MSRVSEIRYAFVDTVPKNPELGTIYISIKYRLIIHLCLCGCDERVTLNLAPNGWNFTFDGQSISIHESIGNVGIPCRSHYIIRKNHVNWLSPLTGVDPRAVLETESRDVPESEQELSKVSARWIQRLRRRFGRS